MALARILQLYLWRWGIEVNFREEKSLLGAGEAQVRTEPSCRIAPALVVAAYAMLWTSGLKLRARGAPPPALRPPKRRRPQQEQRLFSTGDLSRALRLEIWGRALRPATFSGFVNAPAQGSKPEELCPNLPAVLFSAV